MRTQYPNVQIVPDDFKREKYVISELDIEKLVVETGLQFRQRVARVSIEFLRKARDDSEGEAAVNVITFWSAELDKATSVVYRYRQASEIVEEQA